MASKPKLPLKTESSMTEPTPPPAPAEASPTEGARSEFRKGRLHKEAVSQLRRMILDGQLVPGERLREAVFSEMFEMSRTPIREAFRTLAAEGLVELLANRSAVVSEIDRSESADVFHVLGALEGLAAQQACERMTAKQIEVLAALQHELVRHFEEADRVAYMEVNRRIHELMVTSTNNTSLISAWRLILPRAVRARTINNLDRVRWAEAVREHQQIFEALSARDAALTARLMEQHFTHGVDSLMGAKRAYD